MRHTLKALLVGATLAAVGLAPVSGTAQEQNQGQGQGQNQGQGQLGGVIIEAGGSNEVYTSDAGESGQTSIVGNPGPASVNTADGQGNQEGRRAARRAAREAERAAAAEAAAPIAAEPAAYDPAPAPAPAPAPEPVAAAPAAAPAVVALPSTGSGPESQAPAALALMLAGLAAVGAFVTFRRAHQS